jgi:hypothetical protein
MVAFCIRFFSITIGITMFSILLHANDNLSYAAFLIPKDISKNANVVVRDESYKMVIISSGKAKMIHRYVYTILNKKGDSFATCVIYYDVFRRIKSLDGALYNSSGNEIKTLKKSEIKDLSINDGMSLMDDSRVKSHHFNYNSYPYTVVYEYEVDYDSPYFINHWTPQRLENQSIEKSMIEIEAPIDYKIKYKVFNLNLQPDSSVNGNQYKLTWEVKNLGAYQDEIAQPEKKFISPTLLFAPQTFEYGKFSGELSSWKTFGSFLYDLQKGRQTLPDNILEKVKAIRSTEKDNNAVVTALYKMMQQSTRYVSIQLGIGGLQPFDAKYVCKNSYGDCKALSNYMHSLLAAAGIASFPAAIKAGTGEKSFISDLPSSQFNHVILCAIPNPKDTMWLECTNQDIPAGYLGSFTCDRNALLITPDGGVLAHTPKYTNEQNCTQKKIEAELDLDGNLMLDVQTIYANEAYDDVNGQFKNLNSDALKKNLNQQFNLATYDVISYDYTFPYADKPIIKENLKMKVSAFAQISGKRIFLNPNILNRFNRSLETDSMRKYPIYFKNGFLDLDTISIQLPASYTIESGFDTKSFDAVFGNYKTTLKIEGNKLFYTRKELSRVGQYPADKYAELVTFYNNISKTDATKIVLIKKE